MRTLIILILIYVAYRVLKGYLFFRPKLKEAMRNTQARDTHGRHGDEEMVLDPVCNSYTPVNSAFRLDKGGKTEYFCSTECREKYLAQLK